MPNTPSIIRARSNKLASPLSLVLTSMKSAVSKLRKGQKRKYTGLGLIQRVWNQNEVAKLLV